MSPVALAQPLPECSGGCGQPMRREDHIRLDGACSSCQAAQRRAAALAATLDPEQVLFVTPREVHQ